jgi:hypothetical protein
MTSCGLSRRRELTLTGRETVGVTERAAQRITNDLVEAGYVTRERIGRRNRYRINRKVRMRHPAQREHPIGELLGLLSSEEGPTP